MKVLSTEGLTKLIQLVKGYFTPGKNVSIVNGVISASDKDYDGLLIPDTTNLEVLNTYEYDVSSVTWYKLCSFANTFTKLSDIKGYAMFRITVTGTNINQVVEGIVSMRQRVNEAPYLVIRNYSGTTDPTTSGIRYFRCEYPKTLNNGYNWDFSFVVYNSTARHIKVEVLKTETGFTWYNSLTTSTYNSTYQNSTNIMASTHDGITSSSTHFLRVDSAVTADYITERFQKLISGTQPLAASNLLAFQFAFMNNNQLYPATNKTTAIEPGFGLVVVSGAVTANNAPDYNMLNTKRAINDLTNIPHDTLARGVPCYFRCTMDSNGNILSDNYVATSMASGYTWYYVGIAQSSTSFTLDTVNSVFMTLDSEGKLTHINGKQIAAGSNYVAGTGIDITNNIITSQAVVINDYTGD